MKLSWPGWSASKKACLLHLEERKSERLLLLLMGLSVFHSTVSMQCVLRGERKKSNSQCEQRGVGGSPQHRFTDLFVEHLGMF